MSADTTHATNATHAPRETGAPRAAGPASAPRAVLRRLLYWTPVLLALYLFGQVAFLGLRPAVAEARRLAAADDSLQARYERDVALYQAYDVRVRARRDPVFQERQRRVRRAAPAPHEARATGAESQLAAAGASEPGT